MADEPITAPMDVPVVKEKRAPPSKTLERRARIKKLMRLGYHSTEDIHRAFMAQGDKSNIRTIQRDVLEVRAELMAEISKEDKAAILNDFRIQNSGMYEEAIASYLKFKNDGQGSAAAGFLSLAAKLKETRVSMFVPNGSDVNTSVLGKNDTVTVHVVRGRPDEPGHQP
jgi:hypothetical protein